MYIKYIRTIGYLEGRVKAYEHMVEKCRKEDFLMKEFLHEPNYKSFPTIEAEVFLKQYTDALNYWKSIPLKEKLFFNKRVD